MKYEMWYAKSQPMSTPKRVLCIALALLILLQLILLPNLLSHFGRAADKANSGYHFLQEGVQIDLDKKLEDYDSGTFMLTLSGNSYIKEEFKNASLYSSYNNTYTIQASGYYFLELWGGNGAEGNLTPQSDGGRGGAGGHVYGYMWLEAGQTLVYQLGSNGQQTTRHSEGGGANGDGGGHGEQGIYTVGGGGGYSALYLFDGEHPNRTVTEQERVTNYIMIAGGGGGGGAGNQALYEASGTPNGGAGGSLNSLSGHLSENDNSGVAGTFFRGANGRSSGSSTDYVGRGGGSVPGTPVGAVLGMNESYQANDWTGTYDAEHLGGGGGSGNLRGGGGGAGFCGGSGGIMQGAWIGANVGGGGGGSSFIADAVTWRNIPSAYSSYIQGTNRSASGGSFVITYMGKSTDGTADVSPYKSATLKGSISTYFDIVRVNVNGNGSASFNTNNNTITVTGIDLRPASSGYAGTDMRVEITVRAKADFAGGNNVPVIGTAFALTPSGKTAMTFAEDAATDYANVPLNFKAVARSYMSSNPDKSYAIASLYTDEYASVRSNLSSYWQYAFISSISSYTVKQEGSSTALSGSVSPDTTTRYTVGFTVTLKSEGTATVGAVVPTTNSITATSVITIVDADTAMLGSGVVKVSKLLNYNGTNHLLDIATNQQTIFYDIPAGKSGSASGTYDIDKDGWYYIQLWGGNGGRGGYADVHQKSCNSWCEETNWSSGGTGGYTYGYVYLTAGEQLVYTIGAKGGDGSYSTDRITGWLDSGTARGTGGSAGGRSTVSLGDTTLLIAGGGGGGAGSASYASGTGLSGTAKQGAAGQSSTETVTDLSSVVNAKAGTSGSGTGSSSMKAGTRGTAGNSYQPTTMLGTYNGKTVSQDGMNYANSLTTTKSVTSGYIVITCLEVDESIAGRQALNGLSMSGTISKYFDVTAVSLSFDGSYNATVISNTVNGATYTYSKDSTPVASMTYRLIKNADGTTRFDVTDLTYGAVIHHTGTQIYYTAEPKVQLTLTRKEGFIGGNDVPLLVHDVTESGSVDKDGHPDRGLRVERDGDFMWLLENDVSDYANVPLQYTFADENFATQDTTITCGRSVDQATLITADSIPLPSGEDAWKAEFVQTVHPGTTIVSPTATTTYTFTQQVIPIAAAQKAQVTASVSPLTYSKPSTVYVRYTVTDNMEHLTFEGEDFVTDGENLSLTITPDDGYLLPASIGVTVGGSTLSSSRYTYNSTTGALTIQEQYITGNVVLTGSAKLLTYKLTYMYEQPDGSIAEYSEDYVSGSAIDLTWYNNFNSSVPAREGHDFTWQWETEDGRPLTVMPAQDWHVIGSYTLKAYTLTINYYKMGTTESVAETYTKVMAYQSSYSVLSPAVDGYTPDAATVSGVLLADTTIDVYYTPNDGMLTVFYIYTDSNAEVCDRLIKPLATDETYTVTAAEIPTVNGYTPDKTEVTVTMPASGGVMVYIYYTPNTYTVVFDAGEGTLADGEESKTVVFNNIYGYDPATSAYGELPQPIRTGYEFKGWLDENGNLVKEETVVSYASDHTLTADWKAYTFRLTVYYQYTDGTQAQPTVSELHEYGAAYEVLTPEIIGYTPDIAEVSGNMGGGNRVVYVTYTINIYTITVHYLGPEGTLLAEDYVTEQEYNTTYSITSPTITGYTADTLTVEGTVGPADIDVTVNYAYIEYSLTINYVLSDGPGEQPESYVQEGLHIHSEYAVVPPVVEGYTPSVSVVEGTFGAGDVIETVTYTRNSYSLTIEYLYGEDILDTTLTDTEAAPTVTYSVLYGNAYSYASPAVENYAFDIAEVSGTMPATDVTVTVRYNQVVSVTVTWGDLSFRYKDSVWDPETHTYLIPPETAGSNTVTVKNNNESTTTVSAAVVYQPTVPTLNVFFTEIDDVTTAPLSDVTTLLSVGEEMQLWLWLNGYLTDEAFAQVDENGYITTGVCTVTIGGDNG